MNKYVVGVSNVSDNEIKLTKIEADNDIEAIVLAVGDEINMFKSFDTLTVEDLIQYYFDGDMLVSKPLEVKNF